jgi:hypothetical protein
MNLCDDLHGVAAGRAELHLCSERCFASYARRTPMTYQRDPDRPRNPLAEDMIRKESAAARDMDLSRRNNDAVNNTRIMPVILTLLVLLGVGYLLYSLLMPRADVDAP